MCSRTSNATDKEIAEFLDYYSALTGQISWPLYHKRHGKPTAPTDPQVVMVRDSSRYVAHLMAWGLVSKSSRDGKGHFNARAETVATKPTFKDPFRRRRAVMLIGCYHEWDLSKAHFYMTRADGQPIICAAVWEPARAGGLDTCAMLTTTPNSPMAEIHDRMPVILERKAVHTWLAPNATPAELEALMTPVPDNCLIATAFPPPPKPLEPTLWDLES